MNTENDKYSAETLYVCFAEIERVKAFTKKHKRRSMANPCNGLSVRKSKIQTNTPESKQESAPLAISMGFRKKDHPKNEKHPISHQQSADTLAFNHRKQK